MHKLRRIRQALFNKKRDAAPRADSLSTVVDAEISICPGLCIRTVNSRYQATLTNVLPGEHRIILEEVGAIASPASSWGTLRCWIRS